MFAVIMSINQTVSSVPIDQTVSFVLIPSPGMWDILRYVWAMRDRGSLSEGKTSFTYVGDAAGLRVVLVSKSCNGLALFIDWSVSCDS